MRCLWHRVSPIPVKGRARHRINGNTYTDPNTRAHLARVADSWQEEMYDKSEPLALIIYVYQPLPKTRAKYGEEPFITKPDVDNIAKAVMDGLQGVAFWNDKQIVKLYVFKHPRKADISEPYIEYLLVPASMVGGGML